MGSGTEVAKEASDIVILDDNFLSISKAILYGRTIFKSIRKFIIFQLTINLCAFKLSIVGPFIGVNNTSYSYSNAVDKYGYGYISRYCFLI